MILQPAIQKNDRKARILIFSVSVIVFSAVVILSKFKLTVSLPFNVHVFAMINACINSCVAVLLVAGIIFIKKKHYVIHRNIMMTTIILSFLFLVSYILHHLLAGDTRFGDINHDGILSEAEKTQAGSSRYVYYVLLLTHIPLAGIILPFILFTAYRGLTGEYSRHKRLARLTWPIWLYVAITGVVVYLMIQPYYN